VPRERHSTVINGKPFHIAQGVLAMSDVPKMIEVKLTHMEAWVILRALAAYDAKDEKVPSAKTWIAGAYPEARTTQRQTGMTRLTADTISWNRWHIGQERDDA
jgi:hypothetical protein